MYIAQKTLKSMSSMTNDINEEEENDDEDFDDLNLPMKSPVSSPTLSNRQPSLAPPTDETFTIDPPSDLVRDSSPALTNSKEKL